MTLLYFMCLVIALWFGLGGLVVWGFWRHGEAVEERRETAEIIPIEQKRREKAKRND